MTLAELDVNKLSKLISPHIDKVTCVECCKCYMVPSTAPCGHTLCHGCWIGRKKCATCGTTVSRKTLKLNSQLQKITEHTQELRNEFERIFKVNFDEFLLDIPIEKEMNKDPAKNVRDWLANSENQFSAPDVSQQSTRNCTIQHKEAGNKVQIHSETSRTNSINNIIHVGIPQDDWDKIEEIPDTDDLHIKNKENVIGPMDIEPFVDDLFEFTTNNPRRSSRKRDVKGYMLPNSDLNSADQNSTKNSIKGPSSKISKHNWGNVKRMKKEFSKLNKKSKNKLNVSIEMCKKTVISSNKNIPLTSANNSEELVLNIDENTPDIDKHKENEVSRQNINNNHLSRSNSIDNVEEKQKQNDTECQKQINQDTKHRSNTNGDGNRIYNNSLPHPLNAKNEKAPPVAFIMKGALQAPFNIENNNCYDDKLQTIIVNTDKVEQTSSTEDIEITIKVGNTVTNICIKKKEDVRLKINTDREIQTSLEKCVLDNKNNASYRPLKETDSGNNIIISMQNNEQKTSQLSEKYVTNEKVLPTIKSLSSKKNTESADTATAQFEITESIEKELSKEMDNPGVENTLCISKRDNEANTNKVVSDNDILDEDCLNDLDLFDNDTVKEGCVQSLKSSNHAPSEILMPSMKSNKSKKQIDKRFRDTVADDLPINKKMKIIHESSETVKICDRSKTKHSKNMYQDTEVNNYDIIMGEVFANIDLDLRNKTQEKKFDQEKNDPFVTEITSKATPNNCDSIHGQSENVFSILERENDIVDKTCSDKTQARVENPKGPLRKDVDDREIIDQELGTPLQDINDHSDESIVEETPQKNASFQKMKQKSGGSLNTENTIKNKSLKLKRTESVNAQRSSNTPNIMSVINLSDITDDTTRKSKHVTVLQTSKSRPTLETPLTISNFVEQIKHNSTPMARKSLNFDNENTENSDVDPEQTLCPNSFLVAKTTQEKEFMCKAFEDSPHTRANSPLMRHLKVKSMKYCLAGSCLTPSEISNVKLLCSQRKWDYVDKYTKDLTHLVVGVDDENKSQRSVKYMCALAASKWIVSYEWVQKCLQMKRAVDEEPFEALDNTGEPGPQRSRVAKQKLFQGITFFCMPPFSVLDVDTLKGMLEAAGGRVVDEAKAVRVTSDSVALLLAEPEHTQENRFIYLAMELSIVPVNSEWVLNCLGSYTISSVLELLLCPESLLPPATAHWPPELMAKDFD